MASKQDQIFKKASVSHYYASRFFPPQTREDVSKVYAFVRTGDDLVDAQNQKPSELAEFEKAYQQALNGKASGDIVIDEFIEVMGRKHVDPEWIEAYFNSMREDLKPKVFHHIDDTLEYVYGCAEVIGLIMTKILDLPKDSHQSARLLARGMQFANFIRDIDEDNSLGRTYFPEIELDKFGLTDLTEKTVLDNSHGFSRFINFQIKRYHRWHEQGTRGYKYLPKHFLPAVKTAADMYYWSVEQISKDPLLVFERKVKPSKLRVAATGTTNLVRAYTHLI